MGLVKAEVVCRCCLWAPTGMARRDAARLWAVLCGCSVFPKSLCEAQAVLSFLSSSSWRCCQHCSYLCLPLPCVSTAVCHVPKWFGQEYLGPLFLHSLLLILLWFGSVCHSIPSRRLLENGAAEEWAQQLEGSNICMYFFAACHRRTCSTFTEERLPWVSGEPPAPILVDITTD